MGWAFGRLLINTAQARNLCGNRESILRPRTATTTLQKKRARQRWTALLPLEVGGLGGRA
jgi:hypothetical protein